MENENIIYKDGIPIGLEAGDLVTWFASAPLSPEQDDE